MSAQLDFADAAAQIIARMPHAVWRANQMASCRAATLSSGFAALDAQLPGAGWPRSALIELLVGQPGIGELRLLKPALLSLARTGCIVLAQPPHSPNIRAFSSWGIATEQLLWITSKRAGDTLWAAEQILRNGSCGALLLWQTHVRSEVLRRLNLAAQASDTMFWMMHPLANAQNASPSPLRLTLRPAFGGLDIEIVKRRGPIAARSIYLPLSDQPGNGGWTGASVHFSGALARAERGLRIARDSPTERHRFASLCAPRKVDDDADCIPPGETTKPEERKSVQSHL